MAGKARPKKRPKRKVRKQVHESDPLVLTPTADSRVAKATAGGAIFARVTSFLLIKDRMDEAIRLYETSVVPAARTQKGFRGTLLLIDRATGKGQSIGLWESESDALANEVSRYYHEQLAKFLTFFTIPPIREGYELILEARPEVSVDIPKPLADPEKRKK